MKGVSETMPNLGLGCWKIPKDICCDLVYLAIKEANVRMLDCACDYGNEVEVGLGIIIVIIIVTIIIIIINRY